MKTLKLIFCLGLMLSMIACGGSPSTTTPGTKGNPLDPQGNWLFTFTGHNDPVLIQLAGQLFEINPPVVTSGGLGQAFGHTSLCDGSFTFNGLASGTDTINFTVQQTNSVAPTPIQLSLTGTIAPDQAHMSGTWTPTTVGGKSCISATDSGTWSAQLLAPMTGTWTGTESNSTVNLSVSTTLTEVTDQTSPVMGQVTGTVTLLGSPCFANSTTLTIPPETTNAPFGRHSGEFLIIIPIPPNADGISLSLVATVLPDTSSIPTTSFTIHGGVCDGMEFEGTLTH